MESDSSDKPRRGRPKKIAGFLSDDDAYGNSFHQTYSQTAYGQMMGGIADGINNSTATVNNSAATKYTPQFAGKDARIIETDREQKDDDNRAVRKEKRMVDLSEILNFESSGMEDNLEGEYLDVRPMVGAYACSPGAPGDIQSEYIESGHYKDDGEYPSRGWEKGLKIDFNAQTECAGLNSPGSCGFGVGSPGGGGSPSSQNQQNIEDVLFNFFGKDQISTGRSTQWALPGQPPDDPSRNRQFLNINHLYRLPANYTMNGLSFGFRKKRRGNQGVSSQWTRGRVSASRFSSLEYIQNGGYGYTSSVGSEMMRPEKCLNLPLILNSGVAMTQDSVNVLSAYKKELRMLDMENVTVFQLKMFMKRFGMNYTGKKHEIIEYIKEMYRKMEGIVINIPKETDNVKLAGDTPAGYDNVFF